MADNLKMPAGAAPPRPEASKVQPKKETVRISLPPKPGAKETVRLELPPRTATAPAAGASPAPPAAAAPAPPVAKQTVRLSLPPKQPAGGGKETVRLSLPPRPGSSGPPSAPKVQTGQEIKLLVPQVDASAASAKIPDATDAGEDMPTMASTPSPARPAAAAPGGLKSGPPGSRPAAGGPPASARAGGAPASAVPDSTPSAAALPAKRAAPKPEMATLATGMAVRTVARAGVWDVALASLAMVFAIAAAVRLYMIVNP